MALKILPICRHVQLGQNTIYYLCTCYKIEVKNVWWEKIKNTQLYAMIFGLLVVRLHLGLYVFGYRSKCFFPR